MQMIKIAEGAYVVPAAVGAVKSECERFEGSGTLVCRTKIISNSGGVLFDREDRAKLNNANECSAIQAAHHGYVNALLNG